VQTRLGTLKFFDGFPDKVSVSLLYDNLDFQRAVQAYLLALPAVNVMGLREGLTKLGPPNFTIPTFESMMDLLMSALGPKHRQALKTTGYKQFLAKAGIHYSAFTGRWSPGSIKPGNYLR
jgi:hypothetical protein